MAAFDMSDLPRHSRIWAPLLLTGAVLAVYGQVGTYDFVGFDDPGYVTENPIVAHGLTWEGVQWAFTTGHMWNWSPLTWLSHMLDVQLFGLAAGAHHLVNVAFHLANTLLLFFLLQHTTKAFWPSVTVAALFAVHPLHVESVAWISERKDVLSTFWWFVALAAYARYVETRSARWYGVALASFALGLTAKPMLVTLPFVLLLLDVWPLERLTLRRGASVAKRRPKPQQPPRVAPLIREKIPFFALTVVFSIVTYYVQSSRGAVEDAGALPLGLRVANATIAYVRYLGMAVWPVDLAVLYPYEMDLPPAEVVGAALFLVVVSAIVLRVAPGHRYALTGWLWYLGTLVPVIGFVQAGAQAYADRFTYVPLIGVFVLLAWGVRDLVARWSLPSGAVGAVMIAGIGAYALTASAQVTVWRTSETLFNHAARVTHGNFIVHNNLGVSFERQGNIDAAIEEYRESLRIKPDYAIASNNLANLLRGRYERGVSEHPDDPIAHYGFGTSLRDSGRPQEAIEQYEHALRLKPDYVEARFDLAGVLASQGRFQDAIEQYQQGLRLAPDNPKMHFNLGNALAGAGRMAEALEQYRRVVSLAPADATAWGNLSATHAALHQTAEAAETYARAVELARAQRQWELLRRLEDWQRSRTAK